MAEDGWRFTKKKPTALVVYTDGSGIGNGKKGAKAGLGVWWGDRGEAGAKCVCHLLTSLFTYEQESE